MELEESTCLTSDYTTKPQSSREYGTPLLLLIFFLCAYSLFDQYVSFCVSLWVYPAWHSLFLLDLIDYFLFHVGEIFLCNLFKIFSCPFFFSSAYGIPIIQILLHLILSKRSLRLCSVLFILFTLFCSSEFICIILSSSSLIRSSASDTLLSIPSKVFLISKLFCLYVYSLILLGLC